MIINRRFNIALSIGLGSILIMAFVYFLNPINAYSIAGSSGTQGMRLYSSNLVLDGLGLVGVQEGGVDTTNYQIGSLVSTSNMVIEKDFSPSSFAPGAGEYTLRIEAPFVSAPNKFDVFAANSCVRGVGITNFSLFQGLVDPFINAAVENGFNPNLVTVLVNLIGPLGIINFTVKDYYANAIAIKAGTLKMNSGMSVSVVPRTQSPSFSGGCI